MVLSTFRRGDPQREGLILSNQHRNPVVQPTEMANEGFGGWVAEAAFSMCLAGMTVELHVVAQLMLLPAPAKKRSWHVGVDPKVLYMG